MEKENFVVGLMSGTSLDGIDAALVKIKGFGERTKVELLGFQNISLSEELKNEILNCCSIEKSNVQSICSLNFKLGYEFGSAVKSVCKESNFPLERLDFIGSHGQTIYHVPFNSKIVNKSTLQIGEPAVIAYETRTMVVSNFRTMDMAAGGQGAPLVPYSEYLIYKNSKSRALQNLGGIGNVTIIPKDGGLEDIYAFDTGPGNMIINAVVKRLKGLPYDKDGLIASGGNINEKLLNELMSLPYIKKMPPKTTGRELFSDKFIEKLLYRYKNVKEEDLIATVTMFTAKSIEQNYRNFVFQKYRIEEVILGGGGSYNKTLVRMIKNLLPECKVMVQEDLGYSSDAKEAIAFAVLANETIHGLNSNVLGATGAKRRVILGNITPKPY